MVDPTNDRGLVPVLITSLRAEWQVSQALETHCLKGKSCPQLMSPLAQQCATLRDKIPQKKEKRENKAKDMNVVPWKKRSGELWLLSFVSGSELGRPCKPRLLCAPIFSLRQKDKVYTYHPKLLSTRPDTSDLP